MASTYSDLKIELIGTGEQVGSWGSTTNTNLGTALEEAITGSADVTFSSADITLTLTNNNSSQTARNLRLVCTGTSGGARQLILGSGCQINKLYLIQNDLADAVTVKNTTGTGVTIAAGKKQFVFNNGTNVVAATDATVNLASDVTGTLPIANGGTGSTSTTYCNLATNVTGTLPATRGGTAQSTYTTGDIIYASGTNTLAKRAVGSTGQVLTVSGGVPTWATPSEGGTVTSVAASGGSTGFTFSGSPITTSGTLTLAVSSASTVRSAISVPSTTGTGASGSWNINITGSANTATSLSTASGSAPSYSARAWVNFNGTGTVAIRSSGNVTSITDNGTGLYTVNFTTAMSDANYSAVCTNLQTTANGLSLGYNNGGTLSTSEIQLRSCEYRGIVTDREWLSVGIFR